MYYQTLFVSLEAWRIQRKSRIVIGGQIGIRTRTISLQTTLLRHSPSVCCSDGTSLSQKHANLTTCDGDSVEGQKSDSCCAFYFLLYFAEGTIRLGTSQAALCSFWEDIFRTIFTEVWWEEVYKDLFLNSQYLSVIKENSHFAAQVCEVTVVDNFETWAGV